MLGSDPAEVLSYSAVQTDGRTDGRTDGQHIVA